jgi:phosphatidylglycerol:prolipoprotein diacylglycerol transferase
MYVVHYWERDFADAPNRILAIGNLCGGGLEFIGGFLGALGAIAAYLLLTKQSIRLYLDIMAPGAMWGLAIGRIGCFFNGCCFGGLCLAADANQAQYPWAVEFPFASPAYIRQWEDRQVTAPAELITARGARAHLVPALALSMSVERRERYNKAVEQKEKALADARAGQADSKEIRKLERSLQAARRAREKEGLGDLARAQRFPSRYNPERQSSVSELEELADSARSLPVHPAQLYASIHAFALSALLSAIFYRRKRHGIVIGLLLVLYPIGRVLLELIRADNPHDAAGLTISQFIGLSMVVIGLAYLFILYRFMPERSPVADAARPKEDDAKTDGSPSSD